MRFLVHVHDTTPGGFQRAKLQAVMIGTDSRCPQRKSTHISIARSSLGGSVIITLIKHNIPTDGKEVINSGSTMKRSRIQNFGVAPHDFEKVSELLK